MADAQFYVTYLRDCHREADQGRKLSAELWTDAWRVYHNQFDYSKKAASQMQLRWSRFAGTVETFAAVLKRAMIEARVWYVVEGTDEEGKARAPLLKRLTDLWLRLANFVVLFTDGLKLGGIADMIALKATWPAYEEQDIEVGEVFDELAGLMMEPLMAPKMVTKRKKGLKIELLDPFKVWLDPTGRNRYVLEESTTDYDELQQMARLNPRDWDTEAIGRLTAAAQAEQQKYEEARRTNQAQSTTAPWRKPIRLLHFYGDVVNEETGKIEHNVTWTVANDRELVGKTRPFPWWHGLIDRRVPNKRGPIVWGFPFRIPLDPYGKGLARDNLDLAVLLTDLSNAIGDQTKFAGINAFLLRKHLVDDPEQLKGGIFPGIMITQEGGAPGERVLESIQLGQVNPQLLNVLGLYDRQYQNSSMVSSYVETTAQAKTSTLGEYQGRQTQNLGALDMVARNLEDQLLEPFLEMVYWLIIQYMDDFTDPAVVDAMSWTEKLPTGQTIQHNDALVLAAMSDMERFRFLKANVRFAARGMSVVLAKAEELQKLDLFINRGLPALAKVIPNIQLRVNWDAILRKSVEALNWDPDEILRPPQEIAVEQEAQIPGMVPGMQPGMTPTPNGPVMPQPGTLMGPTMPGGGF